MEIGFMLEKVQMSPEFSLCIMDRTACMTANRTRKLASPGKIQMNIKMFLVNIKSTLRNLCQWEFFLYHFRELKSVPPDRF